MRTALPALAVLALAAAAAAEPITLDLGRHAVRVPAHAHRAFLEAHAKGATGPERALLKRELEALRAAGPASVDAQTWGYAWSVNVTIGTPAQTHNVLFDTGSGSLWVWGAPPVCATDACAAVPGYDPRASRTAAAAQYARALKLDYSDSSAARGSFVRDTVGLGPVAFPYDFGLATDADMFYWKGTQTVGILGALRVAAKSGETDVEIDDRADPWWVEATKRELIDGVLGLEIVAPDGGDVQRNQSSYGGKLTIGGVDHSAFEGELAWAPVQPWSPIKWQVKLDGVVGADGKMHEMPNGTAFVDSGSTGFILAQKVAHPAVLAIPGAKVVGETKYGIPCNTTQTIALVFGGRPIPLGPAKFLGKRLSGEFEGLCEAKMDFNPNVDNGALIGDYFFHSAYHAYRLDPPAVGFAPYKRKNGTESQCGGRSQV